MSRAAYRLGYACQREAPRERYLRRLRKIDRRLGGAGEAIPDVVPDKPKWMRWRTYECHVEAWELAAERAEYAFAVTVARFLKRYAPR